MQQMIKKLTLGILIAVFLFPAQVLQGFSDIGQSPFRDSIRYLESIGVINGYEDGSFRPLAKINRAELMKVLVLSSSYSKSDFENSKNCFPDVKEEWFAKYVCFAKNRGWVKGYPDGNFRPQENVNRVEAIKMILNSQYIDSSSPSLKRYFDDVAKEDWFFRYVQIAAEKRILINNGQLLSPGEQVNRGEVSEMSVRALGKSTLKDQTFYRTNNEEFYPPSSDEYDPNYQSDPSSALPSESKANDLAVWANDGGEKIVKDELRASRDIEATTNSVWDGEKIRIFGAKNEVVSFNLIIEADEQDLTNVTVAFDELTNPQGERIETTGNDVFNWTNRNIELFFVRYLEIKGISAFMAENYDQRHLPKNLRAPHDENGIATGGWDDRPNHNKFYPEIAVPLELEQSFKVAKGENQSIWVDVYIPKNIGGGVFTGEVEIWSDEGASLVPVELEVLNFELPDSPTAKTMLVIGDGEVNSRYLGESYPIDESLLRQSKEIVDKHFQLAHRHKVSLVGYGDHHLEDRPNDEYLPRLNGSLFTAANGYDGPGVGIGTNVYSIGLYSSWRWKGEGKESMQKHVNGWEEWFQNNLPDVERFIYLIDESDDFDQIETWARWINETDGPGANLKSMATTWVVDAYEKMPSLDLPASTLMVADKDSTQEAVNYYQSANDKDFYMYNSGRPGNGSFMTDDVGVALRQVAWSQFKMGISRWFYWQSTYWKNFQAGLGETDLFAEAHTFGGNDRFDDSLGETGWNHSNGDGVLFYPGTDVIFPKDSYGIAGPIASLRLKHWRRGIQDHDYLAMAAKIDPAATDEIVRKMIPRVLWEYGIDDPNDPSWVRTEISWSENPDEWEVARRELAEIIQK